MKRIALMAAWFGLVAGISALPLEAQGACLEGRRANCFRNGCQGARECVDGHLLGCEVPVGCMAPPPVVSDHVTVQFAVPGEQVGILFDGSDAHGTFNDRGRVFTATATAPVTATATLSDVRAPAFGNTLVVFSRSRQPRLWPANWTQGADTIQVPLDNNLRFNVTFWILSGTFATRQTQAAAAVLAVNNAYALEKAGIRIAWVTINDVTGDPRAGALQSVDGNSQAALKAIGFNSGEINVYVADIVLGGTNMGATIDGTPVIMLAQNILTFPQLFEHELGHAFSLAHVGAPLFNFENVMNPVVSAHFLSEGQTFRMNFLPSSQLNAMNLRPTQATFVCADPATPSCPAVDRRLWPDGMMPAN